MPIIFPQGSFNLGTVTRPLTDIDEFDIDLVIELVLASKSAFTPYQIKKMIGDRLKQGRYKDMIKSPEGSRCWTIEYAESTRFHMDLLPSIPDSETRTLLMAKGNSFGKSGICITDRNHPDYYKITEDWPRSNPKGYLEWFKSQMIAALNESKNLYARDIQAKVEDVPDYKVKTTLQKAIQLLKRHRDLNCEDNEDKPISIIITTLAAKAYNNEPDLYAALMHIIDNMEKHITYMVQDGKRIAVIENPVDYRENFADKWIKHPIREAVFYEWLIKAKQHFRELNKKSNIFELNDSLGNLMGRRTMEKVFTNMASDTRIQSENGNLLMAAGTGHLTTNIITGKTVQSHNFYGGE